MLSAGDHRHRAPFAHQSSSLDLYAQNSHYQPYNEKYAYANGLAAGPPSPRSSESGFGSVFSGSLGGFGGLGNLSSFGGLSVESLTNSLGNAVGDSSLATRLMNSLPKPATVKFVTLCTLWYASSAVSSNTGKVILNRARFPITLTIVQFAFVSGLCWVISRRQLGLGHRLRRPTRQIVVHTLPMAAFQVGGHIFGSLAISRVPVSTVHSIKALSPLFTVLAYALLFRVSYSPATYLSLLPLTLGVMLATSFDISLRNFLGLICAFGSTIIFVSQNIFFKKVMPSPGSGAESTGPRLDKINLLYFSSSMAFLLMTPIWLWVDAPKLLSASLSSSSNPATGGHSALSTAIYYAINGTVHFAQNLLAFSILASTSPVTYSIASLVKRIAVICLAIVWFKQAVHPVQAVGIALTALGLWMYNKAKRDVDRGEKKVRAAEMAREGVLPQSTRDEEVLDPGHKVHKSPRPEYRRASVGQGGMANGLVNGLANGQGNGHQHHDVYSQTSALRQFVPPPPPKYKQPVVQGPYPSPPASTASSPPLSSTRLDEPVGLGVGVGVTA